MSRSSCTSSFKPRGPPGDQEQRNQRGAGVSLRMFRATDAALPLQSLPKVMHEQASEIADLVSACEDKSAKGNPRDRNLRHQPDRDYQGQDKAATDDNGEHTE